MVELAITNQMRRDTMASGSKSLNWFVASQESPSQQHNQLYQFNGLVAAHILTPAYWKSVQDSRELVTDTTECQRQFKGTVHH